MSDRPRALVLLNPAAGGGRALRRFHALRPALEERFEAEIVATDGTGAWRGAVARARRSGVDCFLAAGGDGTVGALVDALHGLGRDAPLESCILGALALGSSNDFHKPPGTSVAGVPVRWDVARSRPRDVGLVSFEDGRGRPGERAFVVSASLGVTAAANAFFNGGDRLLRSLKRECPPAAIVYAALHELRRGGGVTLTLDLPSGRRTVRATSLSVLKSPHLAGALRFDTPVAPDDGLFAVNLVEDRGRAAALAILAGLARGRFLGSRGTAHWRVRALAVDLPVPGPLELDGEVFEARRARFEVLPERIRACA